MFFNDFQFLPNKMLIGIRISINTERSDRAKESSDFQHFSFSKMLQSLVRVTFLLDVSDDTNSSEIAYE